MDEKEQLCAFADDIEAVVMRYRQEFDITIASAVGVLHCTAFQIMKEASESED